MKPRLALLRPVLFFPAFSSSKGNNYCYSTFLFFTRTRPARPRLSSPRAPEALLPLPLSALVACRGVSSVSVLPVAESSGRVRYVPSSSEMELAVEDANSPGKLHGRAQPRTHDHAHTHTHSLSLSLLLISALTFGVVQVKTVHHHEVPVQGEGRPRYVARRGRQPKPVPGHERLSRGPPLAKQRRPVAPTL